MTANVAAAVDRGLAGTGLHLQDGLILLSWLLFLLLLFFTRFSPRLRVFRTPILLLVLSATASRAVEVFRVEGATIAVAILFTLAIAYLIARVIVFVSFDLIVDRRRKTSTPALIKSLIFFGLLLISLVILNESMPEQYRIPLTSLLASAAVISVVLGLALQDTLGNLFSGLALHLEHPIKAGHWIKVGDSVGKVVEMDWRAIKLRTLGHDYHVLPNSLVASERIVNYSDPPTPHRRELIVRAPYSASPDNVISAIMPILKSNPEVEDTPVPSVLARDFGDHWIDYEVRYWYRDYERLEALDGEIRRQVWYHFRRSLIESPVPLREVYLHEVKPESQDRAERLEEMTRRLRSIHVFEPLNEEELQEVVEGMQFALFAAGERIIEQGKEGDSFFVIYSGVAEVSVRQADGGDSVVKLLRRGDYFGEMALLTGERRTASITAISECGCYRVDRELFKRVLERNPSIVEALSASLSARRAELTERIEADEALRRERKKEPDLKGRILARIKKYFGLK